MRVSGGHGKGASGRGPAGVEMESFTDSGWAMGMIARRDSLSPAVPVSLRLLRWPKSDSLGEHYYQQVVAPF